MKISERNWIAAALLLAGVLLRAEYLREFAATPLFAVAAGPDVSEYHAWACRILSGELLPPEAPIHAPLYAFFLAGVYHVFGTSVAAARIVQLLLNCGAWAALYLLLRRETPGKEVRLQFLPELFFGFAMFYTPLIYYQAELVSESLLLPLLAGALWFFSGAEGVEKRARNLFLMGAGFCCGLAAVAHPMALGVFGLELVYWCVRLWRDGRKLQGAGGLLAAFCIAVFPVSFVNSRIAERFVLIQANSGFNLYLGHNPEADGSCRLRPGKAWRDFHSAVAVEAKEKHTTPDALLLRRVADFYRAKPYFLPYLAARKAVLAFHPRELVSGADPHDIFYATAVQRAGMLWALLLFALAIPGLVWLLTCGSSRAAYVHFLLLGAGVWGMQIATVSSGRYRALMAAALFLGAAWGLCRFFTAERRVRLSYGGGVLLTAALLAAAFARSEPGVQAEVESRVIRGEAYLARRDAALALGEYRAARALLGDHTAYASPIGKCLESVGDLDGAFAEYRAAAAAGDGNGLVNCGVICVRQKKRARAGMYFQEAVRRSDANANAFYNYGVWLCDEGREHDGIAALHRALELDPAHADTLNRMGAISFAKGRYEYAVTYFERACAVAPGNPFFLRNLALSYQAQGRTEESARVQEKLRRRAK